VTIDVASQEQAFRNQMLQIPGAEIITEMVAESIRMGGSTYNPATRTVTVEGVRMQISSQGLRLPNS
jgi:hypothetical protein